MCHHQNLYIEALTPDIVFGARSFKEIMKDKTIGQSPDLIDWCAYKRKKCQNSTLSFSLTDKRPHEDTARNRPSVCQRERSLSPETNSAGIGSGTSDLQNYEKNKSLFFRWPSLWHLVIVTQAD